MLLPVSLLDPIGGVVDKVASEYALRCARALVVGSSLATGVWPDGWPESLRSPCRLDCIQKTKTNLDLTLKAHRELRRTIWSYTIRVIHALNTKYGRG
ncbi:hypothetical protein PoB_002809700, partial [Plakobranchus ocellatus]